MEQQIGQQMEQLAAEIEKGTTLKHVENVRDASAPIIESTYFYQPFREVRWDPLHITLLP